MNNISKRKTISFRTPKRGYHSRCLTKKNPYNAYLYFCEERRKSFTTKGKDEPNHIQLSAMWDELSSEEKEKVIQKYNQIYQSKEEQNSLCSDSASISSHRESFSCGQKLSLYSYNPEINSIIQESLMKRGKSEVKPKRTYQYKKKNFRTTIKKYKNSKEIRTPMKRICLCGYCHFCRLFNYSNQNNIIIM